jgi:hypothetical protein
MKKITLIFNSINDYTNNQTTLTELNYERTKQ